MQNRQRVQLFWGTGRVWSRPTCFTRPAISSGVSGTSPDASSSDADWNAPSESSDSSMGGAAGSVGSAMFRRVWRLSGGKTALALQEHAAHPADGDPPCNRDDHACAALSRKLQRELGPKEALEMHGDAASSSRQSAAGGAASNAVSSSTLHAAACINTKNCWVKRLGAPPPPGPPGATGNCNGVPEKHIYIL